MIRAGRVQAGQLGTEPPGGLRASGAFGHPLDDQEGIAGCKHRGNGHRGWLGEPAHPGSLGREACRRRTAGGYLRECGPAVRESYPVMINSVLAADTSWLLHPDAEHLLEPGLYRLIHRQLRPSRCSPADPAPAPERAASGQSISASWLATSREAGSSSSYTAANSSALPSYGSGTSAPSSASGSNDRIS